MIKLDKISINDLQSVQITLDTLLDKTLIDSYKEIYHYFVYHAFLIDSSFKNLESYKLTSCMIGLDRKSNPVLHKNISKKKLNNLYGYMRDRKDKDARKQIYNVIKSSADMCPYCGECNPVTTLDHYLPKADFPQYSVFTSNLLPSCGTCNTGKLNTVATCYIDQPIHPYFDKSIFFNDIWIEGSISDYTTLGLNIYTNPPSLWSNDDKLRASKHFKDYRIEAEYKLRINSEASQLLYLLKNSLRMLTGTALQEYLIDCSNTPGLFENHWRKVFYRALAKDPNIFNRVQIH
ncbi:hypothetical protein GCM10023206_28680 [Acinetobacter puyangensis]|uniref:HNH endonuclease n=1 Tax=Acinetobacter puyangensis TaxID=1096779 RepID=A0A240E3L4_9GAMM|nr:hypothetical protein [Acinetobacter puyangensis]SNX43364.1 hypothetical protein SAMN05421731_101400 [Acinetobacter puyangensis]